MTIKFSVVIATYNTGERLIPTVNSVLAQTLPAAEYELLLVDDGSTDDTPRQATALAERHPQVIALGIEHSGWPGRPRNVGVDHARGEYILFMDHDDDIFPEALERMYEYAKANRADVLLAKEVGKGRGTPGWTTYLENVPRVAQIDQVLLESLTPHKAFRREFLNQSKVRFPEGNIRLEDYNILAQAYVRAERISILAEHPCYRWIHYPSTATHKKFEHAVYWDSFVKSLGPVLRELEPGNTQDAFLARWFSGRILQRVGPFFQGYDDEYRDVLLRHVSEILHLFPERVDQLLSPMDQLRAAMLRADDRPNLHLLSKLDHQTALRKMQSATAWSDGKFHVSASAMVCDSSKEPMLFAEKNGAVTRVLPEDIVRVYPTAGFDLSAAIAQGQVELSIRGVDSGIEWPLPEAEGTLSLVPTATGFTVKASAQAQIDLHRAAFGEALGDDIWHIWLRVRVLGLQLNARIPADIKPARAALIHGKPVVAFVHDKKLALDLGARARTIVGAARPSADQVQVRRSGNFQLSLPEVHVHGPAEISGELLLDGRSVPALLATTGTEPPTVTAHTGKLPAGTKIETRFLGRLSATGIELTTQGQPAATLPQRLLARVKQSARGLGLDR